MGSKIPNALAQALHRGATVVTPHERAARAVRSEWDLQQKSAGKSSWATPKALSWRAWTAELWHLLQLDGAADLTLLNATQERHLWTSALEQGAEMRSESAVATLALRCIEAHRRLETYIGDGHSRATRAAAGQPFSGWLQQVQDRCRRSHFVLSAELDLALAKRLGRRTLSLLPSPDLVLYGFDEFPPAMQGLCAAWERAGGRCERVALATLESIGAVLAGQTEEDEMQQFSIWASDRLRHLPDQRIALVVSDLERRRDEVEAVLRDALTFAPEQQRSHALELPEKPTFEFSLGRSMITEPLIQAALDLVRWTRAPLHLSRITRLLLSPHFAHPGQHRPSLEQRTQVERRLRRGRRLRPEADVADVIAVCDEMEISSSGSLRQSLHSLLTSPLALSAHLAEGDLRPAASWVADLRSTLTGAMWGLNTSSYAFQLRARWDALLDELATLDLIEPGITFARLFAVLERQTRDSIFAPESREAPIQILGPIEAAGQQFDAIWVSGCSHLQWPPERATSGLLPLGLQRDAGAPGADRDRERAWATSLTQRLASSASIAVFSYAQQTREAADQHLSPLLEALHLPLLPAQLPSHYRGAPIALERVEEAAAVSVLPTTAAEGGARLLQLQAACGFRAFAELRLRAQEIDQPSLGLDPRDRGNAVHAALDAFWKEMRSQERLLALSPAERDRALSEAVEHGLRSVMVASGEDQWAVNYLDVQRVRLHRLLEAWLDKEQQRPPFTVLGSELILERVPVGPLSLSVRIDRLDLVDGHHVLLDYKTSKSHAGAWHGERPEQPQMLLYAMLAAAGHLAEASPAQLGALAFANVLPGADMSLSGLQQEGSTLLQLSNRRHDRDVAEQVERWTQIIHRLATEFAAGKAHVDPANYPGTCQYCAQRLLCRLAPELLLEAEVGSGDHEAQGG